MDCRRFGASVAAMACLPRCRLATEVPQAQACRLAEEGFAWPSCMRQALAPVRAAERVDLNASEAAAKDKAERGCGSLRQLQLCCAQTPFAQLSAHSLDESEAGATEAAPDSDGASDSADSEAADEEVRLSERICP